MWLDWRTVLCEFSGRESTARIAYRKYVLAGLEQPLVNPMSQAFEGLLLGSPEFIKTHRHLIEDAESEARRYSQQATLDDVLTAVAESFETSVAEITRRGRHTHVAREVAIWLARETVRVPLNDLAVTFGVSKSTASEAITRCETRQKRSEDLRVRCATLTERVLDRE